MEKFFKRPWIIVAVIAVITIFFAAQLPRVVLDNNNFRFVPESDPARQVSVYIDNTFGSSQFILVGLEKKYGTVLDRDFLLRLGEYIERIREIDVVGNINSIVNADYITGDGESIIVEKLVADDFSGTAEEIAELKRRLLSWNMYERALISDDFTATQVYVPLSVSQDEVGSPEIVAKLLKIRDIAREMFAGYAKVYVAGFPIVSGTISEAVFADLRLLIPLVIIIVLLIIYLPLRRIGMVFLSLLGVIVAVIWSIGAMPLLGVKLSVITTVMPVVLIAVGNSYGLHVIIHYMEGSGRDFALMSREEHSLFIVGMLRKVLTPIFLAALTTFVSFVSFCFTAVIPIREFGAFSSFGVLCSFVIAIVLVPAILIIRGPVPLKSRKKARPENRQADESGGDNINDGLARAMCVIVAKKRTVITLTAIIGVVSVFGAAHLVIDNVFTEYFRADTDIVKSDQFIRAKFGGSKVFSVVVQSDSTETLLHPDTLTAMDNLNTYLIERVAETGKVMGFTDLVKRINQVFNIGESPEGLRSRPGLRSTSVDTGSAGFGFADADDSFGFGFSDSDDSFGFGGFAEETIPNSTADTAVSLLPDSPLSTLELLALLDSAASSHRQMNASDLVAFLKKKVNYEGAAYYEIPADPARYGKQTPEELQALVSNYLVLLAGNISEYANDPLEPTAIKTTIQLRTAGQEDTDHTIAEIRRYVDENFPKNVEVIIGGGAVVEGSVNDRIVGSLWTSIAIAVLSLFIIITIVNRSFIAGLISVVPLGLLILVNFAIMGFTGIKLNVGTALISSLTLGIGIDYIIHFLEAYKGAYRESGGKGDFLKSAYRTSGLAVITDAVSTGAGFVVLIFSNFVMLAQFGLLTALSLLLSAIVGLIVVPALLLLVRPKFITEYAKRSAL
ncbi:antibiotic transporter [Spirochaetia bacterium]|nr:antibiotic transporter [Spirochaetia bacterium]